MGKVTKTAAAVAAAAAVGGGIVLYNSSGTAQPEAPAPYVDTVEAVRVEIPRVVVPSVSAPAVDVPAITSYRAVSAVQMAELHIPADAPVVADPAADMPRQIALQKELMTLFRDQRTLMYADATTDAATWRKWIALYQSAELREYRQEFRPLEKGLRIINEVKCPVSAAEFATLQQRLGYYSGRGYNAVLVTFDTTEDLRKLCVAVDYIRSSGFKVVIAYAGREHLSEPVFRDPDVLHRWLAMLGSRADALLLGWRRTSLHLFLPDRQWNAFLIRAARSRNPELATIGAAYFGETADTPRGVTYNVPENCSAVLVVGLGYPRASTRRALETVFPEALKYDHLIGLAVGEKPYFDTLHSTGKTQAANDTIKRRIEIRLLQAGMSSTMTYSGDGGDGQYGDKNKTENLCRVYGTN